MSSSTDLVSIPVAFEVGTTRGLVLDSGCPINSSDKISTIKDGKLCFLTELDYTVKERNKSGPASQCGISGTLQLISAAMAKQFFNSIRSRSY